MKKLVISGLFALFSFLYSTPALAESILMVVNSANTNAISKTVVKDLYSGRSTSWADGNAVLLIDRPSKNVIANTFTTTIVQTPLPVYKRFWMQKELSGAGVAPKEANSAADVFSIVASNSSALGYIAESESAGAPSTVKLVPVN